MGGLSSHFYNHLPNLEGIRTSVAADSWAARRIDSLRFGQIEVRMITHMIGLTPAGTTVQRDSIGGRPILPSDHSWPTCECGARMVLFLQFDLLPEFGLPFLPGSHLSVFMCPVHNDAPEIFNDHLLPDDFWERRRMIDGQMRFYELFLHRPEVPEVTHPPDPTLLTQSLCFSKRAEEPDRENVALSTHPEYPGVSLSVGEVVGGVQGLKVGGQPSWVQAPEVHSCCCGAEMRFVCQIPLDWPFPKCPDASEQPNSFSRTDYCLFLGNETYLFACQAQCNTRAVHCVVQN